MMRPISEIDADLVEARAARDVAERALQALLNERSEAIIAERSKHPWIGKTVRALRRKRRYGAEMIEKTGVVTVFDRQKHGRIRGVYFNHGEIIVLSASGKSAWRLDGDRHYDETAWELVDPIAEKRVK